MLGKCGRHLGLAFRTEEEEEEKAKQMVETAAKC